jgi:CheY-like chemotaxis protein
MLPLQPPSDVPFALVFDDDVLIRMDACQIVEDAGFRGLEAAEADEAIDILSKRGDSITLLFTDVQMPGRMNGLGVARAAAEPWPEMWIVVASGVARPEPHDMPPRATFLSKPFSAEVVHAELQRLLPDGKKPEPLRQKV